MNAKVLAVSVVLAAAFGSVPAHGSPGPQPVPLEFHVPPPRDAAYPAGMLHLRVDATDLAHGIFNVREVIPVSPGPLFLLYPQWIPGAHSPIGPIHMLAGLVLHANGKRVAWTRDPADVYAFHVNVPKGVSTLDISFQFLTPQPGRGRVVMTPEMLRLDWNTVVLYPAGYFARDIDVQAGVTLPPGFRLATALTVASREGNDIAFEPVDLENLVDSPLLAGEYCERIDLNPNGKTPIHLDVFADQPRDLEITQQEIQYHRNLVTQMYRLYGTFHFNHYDFLFTLSDELAEAGLEHRRSSEDGTDPGYFTQWGRDWAGRDILAHEFNHSWNGKFRRPATLWTPSFNVPKRDHGLWVYEGLTEYYGYVMAARSGLWSKQQALEMLALVGATYDRGRPGMKWRNIWDTTNDSIINRHALNQSYRGYQMSIDYYYGGELIWLAVDAELRALTHDERNLNDFARDFFGIHPGAWDIDTFTFDDIVNALNHVARYDWKHFLDQRLQGYGNLSKAFDAEGWKLVYDDEPNDGIGPLQTHLEAGDLTYSIGLDVSATGTLLDVLWDGPAFNAGMAPGMTIAGVNGRNFTVDGLNRAITAAKTGKAPITLLVRTFDRYETMVIDYHGGLQYPHLKRIEGTADYLSQVLAPLDHVLAPVR